MKSFQWVDKTCKRPNRLKKKSYRQKKNFLAVVKPSKSIQRSCRFLLNNKSMDIKVFFTISSSLTAFNVCTKVMF